MRELDYSEVVEVFGAGAPLGSATAGEYFGNCMDYTGPSGTTGAILTGASFLPGVGGFVALGALGWAGISATICTIGTFQYAQ